MSRIRNFVVLAVALSVVTYSASAAVKPGASCTKVGAKTISNGVNYTCIQSGKKKVWGKGVKVAKPAPTTSPTSDSSPAASATPSPSIAVEPAALNTFDDLVAHPEAISYWAWKKSSLQVNQSTVSAPTIQIILGPNSKLLTTKTEDALVAASRLYEGFARPTLVRVIYYSYSDVAWAQSEFNKYALKPSGSEAKNMCQSEDTCWGALSEVDLKGGAIILAGLKRADATDSNHTSGTLEAHEFTHALQASQFVGTGKEESSYCCIKRWLPHWMVEGGAEFAQAASVYSDSFKKYDSERGKVAQEFLGNHEGTFTVDWISRFLDPSATTLWNQRVNDWRIYDVGFMANEALVALKGPFVSMQINRDVATGMNWEQAFEKNLGVSWKEAAPKLALAISKELYN